MAFRPGVNDTIIIDGLEYHVAGHPAAPLMPYGQEGRQAIVYQLIHDEDRRALKVFKPRFCLPSMVLLSERLAGYADLPGLSVCRRTVLSARRHPDLLRSNPDLTYAVIMPWVEGPTWTEIMLEGRILSKAESLALARILAEVLAGMEESGLAHCDLSGPNVLLPLLANSGRPSSYTGVELVDIEQFYGPGLERPSALPGGSPGYAHLTAREGLWEPKADRFAGTILLVEMLARCDERARQASYSDESFFDPAGMQRDSEQYLAMVSILREQWGNGVAGLFERAWRSETLADCATFGEWLITLPEMSSLGDSTPPDDPGRPTDGPGDEEAARAAVQKAQRCEAGGDIHGALNAYRQAFNLADPTGALAEELALIIRELQEKTAEAAAGIEDSLCAIGPGGSGLSVTKQPDGPISAANPSAMPDASPEGPCAPEAPVHVVADPVGGDAPVSGPGSVKTKKPVSPGWGFLQKLRPVTWPVAVIVMLASAILGTAAIANRRPPQPPPVAVEKVRQTFALSGRVTDDTGRGIGSTTIRFGEGFEPVMTAEDGSWSRDGLSGMVQVKAEKKGWTFFPAARSASARARGINFSGQLAQYDLAGMALDQVGRAVPGVVIMAGGGQGRAVSDAKGYWSLPGLTGLLTITAQKDGWIFAPPSLEVSGPSEAISFKGRQTTYQVYGRIVDKSGRGVSGVVLVFSHSFGTAKTDSGGYWKKPGLTGKVSVRAEKAGWSFSPASMEFSRASAADRFIGTQTVFSVSGKVTDRSGSPIAGVAISFSDGSSPVITDVKGNWSKTGLRGRVEVTAGKEGFTFAPANIAVNGGASGLRFTGGTSGYAVSGRVVGSLGRGIEGVTITFGGGFGTVLTDARGNWSKTGLVGTVSITPSKEGWTFVPEMRTVSGPTSSIAFIARRASAY